MNLLNEYSDNEHFLQKALNGRKNSSRLKDLNHLNYSENDLLNLYFDALKTKIIKRVTICKTDEPFSLDNTEPTDVIN